MDRCVAFASCAPVAPGIPFSMKRIPVGMCVVAYWQERALRVVIEREVGPGCDFALRVAWWTRARCVLFHATFPAHACQPRRVGLREIQECCVPCWILFELIFWLFDDGYATKVVCVQPLSCCTRSVQCLAHL